MSLMYFKRFRMEISLSPASAKPPLLPAGYELLPWNESLLPAHAEAKYESFCYELDANVFPCLANTDGCLRLMTEISRREGFCPGATWLLRYHEPGSRRIENCGTVQGVCDGPAVGAVQNLGVTPGHRGQGLGTALLDQAITGFSAYGLTKAYLEVTAHNTAAVRLYQRLGFRTVRVVYKAAEVAFV